MKTQLIPECGDTVTVALPMTNGITHVIHDKKVLIVCPSEKTVVIEGNVRARWEWIQSYQ